MDDQIMKPLRIGFFPIVRIQFDVVLAEEMIKSAREHLQATGFELAGPKQPISDLQAASLAVQTLSIGAGRSGIDLPSYLC